MLSLAKLAAIAFEAEYSDCISKVRQHKSGTPKIVLKRLPYKGTDRPTPLAKKFERQFWNQFDTICAEVQSCLQPRDSSVCEALSGDATAPLEGSNTVDGDDFQSDDSNTDFSDQFKTICAEVLSGGATAPLGFSDTVNADAHDPDDSNTERLVWDDPIQSALTDTEDPLAGVPRF